MVRGCDCRKLLGGSALPNPRPNDEVLLVVEVYVVVWDVVCSGLIPLGPGRRLWGSGMDICSFFPFSFGVCGLQLDCELVAVSRLTVGFYAYCGP